MKNSAFTIVLALASILMLQSQQCKANSYQETMQANIEKMYKATTPDELASVSGIFYRVSQAEDNWLPLYYASYSLVRIAFFTKDGDTIDKYLDEAQTYADKLMKLQAKESEVHVLQGLIYTMRITNMSRGMKYSALSNTSLDKALELNPNNPRAYYCKGNNVLHTPSMFGGGKKNALPLYKKAGELFSSYQTSESFWPEWDEKHNQKMLENCLNQE